MAARRRPAFVEWTKPTGVADDDGIMSIALALDDIAPQLLERSWTTCAANFPPPVGKLMRGLIAEAVWLHAGPRKANVLKESNARIAALLPGLHVEHLIPLTGLGLEEDDPARELIELVWNILERAAERQQTGGTRP